MTTYWRLARCLRNLVAIATVAICPSFAVAHEPSVAADSAAVRSAALEFLASLGPELRAQVVFPFESSQRSDWHYIPKDRAGVSLRDMDVAQRRAAHDLMRAALSDKGYLKATSVMALEEILRLMEKDRANVDEIRDQEKYWFAIFGDPEDEKPWGWRVEGHHLSLNFSSATGLVMSSFPMFYGANPAEAKVGPRAGWRVMGDEEDLGRAIMVSLSDEQSARARIADRPPADIYTVPGASLDLGKPAGLPAAEMNEQQRHMLWDLIGKFASNLEESFAQRELSAIEEAGLEQIHFAWAGSVTPGEGHYFRIHGPTFLIEFDNAQGNHIHSVWHSPDNNFGTDVLRRHYADSPHHR